MKQDLNLIPRKEDSAVVSRVLVPALLVLLVFSSLVYTGIMIPKNIFHALELKNNGLEQKINELSDVQHEYQMLMAEMDALTSQTATMVETKDNMKGALDVFYMIEDAAPSEIKLSRVALSEESVIIEGLSPSDSLVAQFMVNLRDSDRFSLTNISKIQPNDVDFAQAYEAKQQGIELPNIRNFQLLLIYPIEIAPVDSEGGEK